MTQRALVVRVTALVASSLLAACPGSPPPRPDAGTPDGGGPGDAGTPITLVALSYPKFKDVGLTPQPLPEVVHHARAYVDVEGEQVLFIAGIRYTFDQTPSTATPGDFAFWRKTAAGWERDPALISGGVPACIHPRKAIATDFNEDGRDDVFVACHGWDAFPNPGETNQVVLSQPDGSYQLRTANGRTGFFHSASAADFNGDGHADVVVTDNFSDPSLLVFLNDGAGNFTLDSAQRFPAALLEQAPYFTVEVLDVTGDGHADLFVAGHEHEGAATSVVVNPGDGNLRNAIVRTLPAVAGQGVVLDVVVTSTVAGRDLWVLRTSSGPGAEYQSRTVQRLSWPALEPTVPYQVQPAEWTEWIIPAQLGGARVITSDDAAVPLVIAYEGTYTPVLRPISYARAKESGVLPRSLPSDASLVRAYVDAERNGSPLLFTAAIRYSLAQTPETATPAEFAFWRPQWDGTWAKDAVWLPGGSAGCIHPRKAIVTDFNGDGREDVFVACHGWDAAPFPGERNQLVLSQSNGLYAIVTASDDVGFFHSATATDFTGDGRPDVIVTNNQADPSVQFFVNQGGGRFQLDPTPRLPASLTGQRNFFTVEVLDVTEDGHADLFLGGHEWENAPTVVLVNPGSAPLAEGTVITLPPVANEGVVLDVVATGTGASRALWVLRTSGGDGTFYQSRVVQKVEWPSLASSLPEHSRPAQWTPWIVTATYSGGSVVTSDDLSANFAIQYAGSVPAPVTLAPLSYAAFKASGVTPSHLPADAGMTRAYLDVDGDGQLELFSAGLRYSLSQTPETATPSELAFWRRQPDDTWVKDPALLASTQGCIHPRKAVVADFNSDARPDVFVVCHGWDAAPFPGERNWIVLSAAGGPHTVQPAGAEVGFFHSAAATDFDGDGDPDVVVTDNQADPSVRILLNQGDGTFRADSTPRLPLGLLGRRNFFTVEVLDVDQDGHADLFVAGHEWENAPPLVVINPGTGDLRFAPVIRLPAVANEGVVLDVTATGTGGSRALWVLRTSGGDGTFYQSRVVQKVTWPQLSSSLAEHRRPYSWTPWILPMVVGGTPVVGSDEAAAAMQLAY